MRERERERKRERERERERERYPLQVTDNAKMFSTVMAVHRAYESSSLYREVVMRGALVTDKELRLLPQEQLYNKVWPLLNLVRYFFYTL